MRVQDKVAIVTGGDRGIGKAIALAFASEGAAVVVAARNLSQLEEVAREIGSKQGKVLAVPTDLAVEEQIRRLMQRTVEQFGRIDVLVNNGGIAGPTAPVANLKLNEWSETLAINLTGAMLCSREALAHMIPRRSGAIVNIVSEGGRAGDGKGGYPMRSPYCCSKMGLIGLTETLAVEVGEYNIRVNAVSPGPIQGERIFNVIRKRAEATGTSFEAMMEELASNCSLKRLATEAETAAAVLFLASDEASGITGQTLPVSCGQHAAV